MTTNVVSSVADSVPQGIDFGYCGVAQEVTRSFTLTNPNTNMVRFEIVTDNCPFQISPLRGMLVAAPNTSIGILTSKGK